MKTLPSIIRLCLIVVLLTVLLVSFVLVSRSIRIHSRPQSPRINETIFERIHIGLPKNEVHAVVGVPPGDYTTGTCLTLPPGIKYYGWDVWLGDDGQICVNYDEDDKVSEKEFLPVMRVQPSLFDRIREWLGLTNI